ncbi:MAG: hypothetical protein M0R51_11360 [Clostridia bacterium]|jgi:hypothetical protein|nr:hypothetical protein [Clostridia bacterium]
MEISEVKNNTAFKAMVDAQLEGPEGAVENISFDRYQTVHITCDITECDCWRECCTGCQVAAEYLKKSTQNDVECLLPILDSECKGVKCKKNSNNSFYEFKSFEAFKCAFKDSAWVYRLRISQKLTEEVKASYLVWNECAELITSLYTVTGYMYLDGYPLLIVCTDRVFAEAPYI